jgi:hypothetical protein
VPRKTTAVRLTGAQLDALLAMGEPHISAALKRLRLRTTDSDTEQVASAIVELLTADLHRDTPPNPYLKRKKRRAAGVQADDGEA